MKKVIKVLGAVSLGVLLLFTTCSSVSAKNFYDMKYGNLDTGKPYKKITKEIGGIYVNYYEDMSSSRKDFNGDGKKEKVTLIANVSDNNQEAEVVLKINNKVAVYRKVSGQFENISFSTMKVQGKCLAVLRYGDEDYAGGGALIYLWKNNQELILLKSYKPKGYLDIYVAKDKGLNKNVLYVQDMQQLADREKWTSNVLKKYKKYVNEMSTSVTKNVYHKFVYRNGMLEKIGKDNFFRVGEGYD